MRGNRQARRRHRALERMLSQWRKLSLSRTIGQLQCHLHKSRGCGWQHLGWVRSVRPTTCLPHVANTQVSLHNPIIKLEYFSDDLDAQAFAEKAKGNEGGNICKQSGLAADQIIDYTCGLPKMGAHSIFGMSIIPPDDPSPGYTAGWCTAHVNQYQRNEFGTGARYRFDVVMYDSVGKQIGHVQRAEVDENGHLSITSKLPFTLELSSGDNDQAFVSFAYNGQTWSCDDNDGGTHECTLGDGPEWGYENGDREGDMGWTCDPPPTTMPPSAPLGRKFMIVGDSISHGMEGDWTWRWRLHAWLSQAHDIEFVGPYSDTHAFADTTAVYPSGPLFAGETAPELHYGTGLYASGVPFAFGNEGHGAYWGRQAAQVKNNIHDWVAQYQPDYLLILLGFNDLGWFVSGPDGLIGNLGQLVENAREAKSDIKLLIGNVVDRVFIEGRQDLVDNTKTYNEQLRNTLPSWFRWESPLAYIDVNSNYNCRPGGCPDGYDGLHPNAMGEYHIAQAFARSLKADFGFTGDDFVVPASAEPRVVSTPNGLTCGATKEGLYKGWLADPQARGYEIRSRLQGMSDWWSSGLVYPSTTASFTTWVLEGQTWEYQVRTKGDNDDRSDWSGSVFCTAHPQTAPGPNSTTITTAPSGSGLQVNWQPVSGYDVNRYGVIIWDRDTEGAFIETYAATCCGLSIDSLKAGHRYSIWVATYVNMQSSFTGSAEIVGGLPVGGRDIVVGGGVPSTPSGLNVVNLDPTTITLAWTNSGGATGYAIYYRSIRAGAETAQSLVGTTTDPITTTYSVGFLFPGTWYYEFCVAAYNGNLESPRTACVVPPKYQGFRRSDMSMGNSTALNGTVVGLNTTTSMADDMQLRELFHLIHHNETAAALG